MRVFLALTLSLSLVLLAGCAPEGETRLHQIDLYGQLDLNGAENTRLRYFYGAPAELVVIGRDVSLRPGEAEGALAVPGALLANGKPVFQTRLRPLPEAPVEVRRIPRTTDLELRVRQEVGRVLYYDGNVWLTLTESAPAGFAGRIAPRPRIGRLQGLGELSREEAAMLARTFEAHGPVVVAELFRTDGSELRVPTDGVAEYLATELYVQSELATDVTAVAARAEEIVWERIAAGAQATGFERPEYLLVRDRAELLRLWNRAHGAQLSVPPVPTVDFARETVLAVFLGQKPTGGHGLAVEAVTQEGSDVFVDLRVTEPTAGSFTTQALTSPWIMVRLLRGRISAAWFRDPDSGELIAVARRTE